MAYNSLRSPMKTTTIKLFKTSKDAIIRARCSNTLKRRVELMCMALDKDISDVLRDALLEKVMKFEHNTVAFNG